MLSPTNPIGPIMFPVKSLHEEVNNLYFFIIVKHFFSLPSYTRGWRALVQDFGLII